MTDFERRSSTVGVNGDKLRGYAVVFNSPSEDFGGFREVITPAAVDRTLTENLDVRALVDHNDSVFAVLGRRSAGTLTLQKDDRGLLVEIHPPATSLSRDLLESVRRGDVTGMSFAFRIVRPHGERFETRAGVATRVISDMRIHEVSIVTFPAYEATDVTIAKRSLQAFRAEQSGARTRLQLRHRVRVT